MKIGIITIWQSNNNYGQLLQLWALQHYLKMQGHNPFLIRYDVNTVCQKKERLRRVVRVYTLVSKIIKLYSILRNRYNFFVDKKRKFDEFKAKHIQSTDIVYYSLTKIQQNPPQADCYITGSDQVWAQLLDNINNEGFFLNFGSSQIKRISYAASFAMTSYPQELKKKLKDKLSIFSAISVRESSGVEICKELGYNVSWVLDPTFLLEQSDYLSLKLKNKNSSPYAFVYFVNINSKENIYWKEVKKYLHQQNYAIYMTSASGYNNKRIHFSGCRYLYPTIEEWLSLIYYSQIMITSSFHGVALSIILNREFVFFPLGGAYSEGNNRVTDLLTLLGLTERIIYRKSDLIYILSKKIEWHSVNRKLDSLRKKSKNFLSVLDDENFIYCNNTNLQ